MNAHELANKLLDGPDVPVYVRGYEGGVDDVDTIVPVQVVRDRYRDMSYYGDHARFELDVWDDEEDMAAVGNGRPTDGLQLKPERNTDT